MPHSWIRNWMDCSWRYCVIIYFKYLYLWIDRNDIFIYLSFVTMMEVMFELFVIAVSEFGTSTIGNLTSNSHNQQFLHKTRFNLKGQLQFGIPLNKRLLGNHPFYPDFFMLQNHMICIVSCWPFLMLGLSVLSVMAPILHIKISGFPEKSRFSMFEF